MDLKVISDYKPSEDQKNAVKNISKSMQNNDKDIVLMGATGTGKSATIAWTLEKLNRPALVIAPNKTLAAQLCNELKELFPQNKIEYFVSYYDYYQPEAYIPSTDTYIEKDSSINKDIEKLRHSATCSLLTRHDTIVVSSVSCIYGLGEPDEYLRQMISVKEKQNLNRDDLIKHLVKTQYKRNDIDRIRGTFSVKGDTVEIIPIYEDNGFRIEFFGNTIDKINIVNQITGDIIKPLDEAYIFPATHYLADDDSMKRVISQIKHDLNIRIKELQNTNRLLEEQRITQRTTFDIEMLVETGSCSGVENYSRYFDNRKPKTPPNTLLDYFPSDFILVIDESHITVPQIGAMFEGDFSRKKTLVQHGFRLPSALDNRPLRWVEFQKRIGQTIYMSATPGDYELRKTNGKTIEQIIRPTGLLDPIIKIKPIKGQVDDLLSEINKRTKKRQRVLITTLTKKMAEKLSDFLIEHNIKAVYMHSDTETIKRVEILNDLRKGVYDCLVGINLLREGLDLPEVSLVAIFDADKQGFLRSKKSLIQTIGRAARNNEGTVIMYADEITKSMKEAIEETERRRKIQKDYNKKYNIIPKTISKKISSIKENSEVLNSNYIVGNDNITITIKNLKKQMKEAAIELNFELAANLRDEIKQLEKELNEIK